MAMTMPPEPLVVQERAEDEPQGDQAQQDPDQISGGFEHRVTLPGIYRLCDAPSDADSYVRRSIYRMSCAKVAAASALAKSSFSKGFSSGWPGSRAVQLRRGIGLPGQKVTADHTGMGD